jgi:hypothetical protein
MRASLWVKSDPMKKYTSLPAAAAVDNIHCDYDQVGTYYSQSTACVQAAEALMVIDCFEKQQSQLSCRQRLTFQKFICPSLVALLTLYAVLPLLGFLHKGIHHLLHVVAVRLRVILD